MPRKTPKSPRPLQLDGPLDVQHVGECRSRLSFHDGGPKAPSAVDLSAITACDTAGLQLLVSARRSATLNGREWRPINPSDAVLRACTEVGIQPEQLGL